MQSISPSTVQGLAKSLIRHTPFFIEDAKIEDVARLWGLEIRGHHFCNRKHHQTDFYQKNKERQPCLFFTLPSSIFLIGKF